MAITSENKTDSIVERTISKWAHNLSERLVEIRFWDVDEMKAAMKVHLRETMRDCLKLKLSEVERERTKLIRKQTDPYTSGKAKQRITHEIAVLNLERKQTIRLMEDMRDRRKLEALKDFIELKFGSDVLKGFYEMYNEKDIL